MIHRVQLHIIAMVQPLTFVKSQDFTCNNTRTSFSNKKVDDMMCNFCNRNTFIFLETSTKLAKNKMVTDNTAKEIKTN